MIFLSLLEGLLCFPFTEGSGKTTNRRWDQRFPKARVSKGLAQKATAE